MPKAVHLYVDDSGTRNPNHERGTKAAHGYDWFALGGVLVDAEDEANAREHHASFMNTWNLDPEVVFLHSFDIRNKTEEFTWLSALPADDFNEFFEDLYALMSEPPLVGLACVIDRPGYEHRYREKYGRQQWSLCKSAFSVLVERAAKYARRRDRKLRVFVERSDKHVDTWMKGYYDELRNAGMPFAADNMLQYRPLSSQELKDTLYEFRTKGKSSPIMQLADLYLWPMAIGGYHRSNRTYSRLHWDNKLIDTHLVYRAIANEGIKYYCWDLVTPKP